MVIDVLIKKCFRIDNLEFAHKIPNGLNGMGRGRNKRILDVLKHMDNYILLCKDCHILYDKGVLKIGHS